MFWALISIILGLILLVWSAGKFIEGSIAAAKLAKISPLVIGMVIVGFGTSAPELAVSVLGALANNSGLALGNAYGSNIANIALILGLTALISPVAVNSAVLKKQLPILTSITFLSLLLIWDLKLGRMDAAFLLLLFSGLIGWMLHQDRRTTRDAFVSQIEQEIKTRQMTRGQSAFWIVVGISLLIASSRLLVFGAVKFAGLLGVSDLVVGLTVVAIGTSLPELASSIMAAIKKENDIALGNIIGSNLFNTLAVVGCAGVIRPFQVDREILYRDFPVMIALTVSLFIFGYGFGKPGKISRREGGVLLLSYACYLYILVTRGKIA